MKNKIFIPLKDKRGLEFKLAFFAIIAISVVTIAVGIWVNDWNDTYNSGLTYDLQDYDELDSMSGQAKAQQGNISVKTSFSEDNFEGTSLRGAFGVINNMFAPFRVVFGEGGMIDSVTTRWGMPDYIRQGIITMMIIAITFALVALLFRKTEGTA